MKLRNILLTGALIGGISLLFPSCGGSGSSGPIPPVDEVPPIEEPTEPTTPDYSAEKAVIKLAADRLVDLQNANGSWDWIVTNATGPTATTYLNISGVTGHALLDANKHSTDSKYLNSAIKTGDYIIDELDKLPDAQHFNAFNLVFLQELAEATGDVKYSNYVTKKMNDLKTKVTFWKNTSNNISTDGTDGLTPEELVASEDIIRNRTTKGIWGIVPWDLYHFVELAKKQGDNTYANGVAEGIKNYLEQAGYNDTIVEFELGLAAGILALKGAGLEYNSALERLLAKQNPNGSFGIDETKQGTAYSLMALKKVGSANAKSAAEFLINSFGYDEFNGWKESDGEEYSEVTSEAAHGLAKYIE